MTQLELHLKSVRESAGAKTNARYQFQTNLAILKLCELFEATAEEFAVLLEHFDDITVIELSESPALSFYQVKAKASGSWTINALAKAEKDKDPASILGRLYENATKFPETTKSLSFLSNAPYSAKLKSGTKCDAEATLVEGIQLHHEEVKKIEAALEANFPAPRDPDCVTLLRLERTPLDVTKQETFVIGRLVEVSESSFGGVSGSPTGLYQVLYTDLVAKAGRVENFGTTDELIKAKGIRRSEFEKLLVAAQGQRRFETLRSVLEDDLKNNGCNSLQIARIVSDCFRYLAARSEGRLTEMQLSARAASTLELNTNILDDADSIFSASVALRDLIQAGHDCDEKSAMTASIVTVMEKLGE